jgi:hypothetical protein
MAKATQVGKNATKPAAKTAPNPFASQQPPGESEGATDGTSPDTPEEAAKTVRWAIYAAGKCVGAVDAATPEEAEAQGRADFQIADETMVSLTQIDKTQ